MKTPRQRDYLNYLRQKLDERKAIGEKVTIKQKQDAPTMVDNVEKVVISPINWLFASKIIQRITAFTKTLLNDTVPDSLYKNIPFFVQTVKIEDVEATVYK